MERCKSPRRVLEREGGAEVGIGVLEFSYLQAQQAIYLLRCSSVSSWTMIK